MRYWIDLHTLPVNHPFWTTRRRLYRSRNRFTSPIQCTAHKFEKLDLTGIETIEPFCISSWQPGIRGVIENSEVAAKHASHQSERELYFFTDGSCRNGLVGVGVHA